MRKVAKKVCKLSLFSQLSAPIKSGVKHVWGPGSSDFHNKNMVPVRIFPAPQQGGYFLLPSPGFKRAPYHRNHHCVKSGKTNRFQTEVSHMLLYALVIRDPLPCFTPPATWQWQVLWSYELWTSRGGFGGNSLKASEKKKDKIPDQLDVFLLKL